MVLEHKNCAFELKQLTDAGSFTGYASIFGVEDDGQDIVDKGAFLQTLSDLGTKGRKVPALWAHDSRQPIGGYEVIREDDKGLWVEGQLMVAEVVKAKETHALMKAGWVSGLSIGFRTKVSEYNTETNVRHLKQVELFEISCVTFPMLDVARVDGVKSLDALDPRALERELKEQGFTGGDAVKAIAIMKRHLMRDASRPILPARDEKGLTELLTAVKAARLNP